MRTISDVECLKYSQWHFALKVTIFLMQLIILSLPKNPFAEHICWSDVAVLWSVLALLLVQNFAFIGGVPLIWRGFGPISCRYCLIIPCLASLFSLHWWGCTGGPSALYYQWYVLSGICISIHVAPNGGGLLYCLTVFKVVHVAVSWRFPQLRLGLNGLIAKNGEDKK